MAKQTINKLTGIRRTADLGAGYLAMLFAGLGLVQVFLAGSGVFGRDFDMHVMLGRILSTVALLVLVLALMARYSKSTIISAIILVILAAGATTFLAGLGWDSKWLGGLHALVGIVSVIMAERMGRRVLKKSS